MPHLIKYVGSKSENSGDFSRAGWFVFAFSPFLAFSLSSPGSLSFHRFQIHSGIAREEFFLFLNGRGSSLKKIKTLYLRKTRFVKPAGLCPPFRG
jgi:hypothetical protein